MCGIIGIAGNQQSNAFRKLFNGLKRLEYRGYDSYGFALLNAGTLDIQTSIGQIGEAEIDLRSEARVGLAHTRWATHGGVTDINAHPQTSCQQRIAVVHNGILTNYLQLRDRLLDLGHEFRSETDTETIPHLIEEYMNSNGFTFLEATIAAVKDLGSGGSYAFAAVFQDEPNTIIFAKNRSPLLVGVGENENYIGSAEVAFLEHTKKYIVLEDMTIGKITADSIELYNLEGELLSLDGKISVSQFNIEESAKGGFKHYMLKEIHEQGHALKNTLQNMDQDIIAKITKEIIEAPEIFFVAAGTSSHSCLVAEFLFENIAGIRTRTLLPNILESKAITPSSLIFAVSQSGETADTISALEYALKNGAVVASLVNMVGTQIPRMSTVCLYTHAGPEIGVAATKTFTTQVIALTRLAIETGYKTKKITKKKYEDLLAELYELPEIVSTVVKRTEYLTKQVGNLIRYKPSAYFLGTSTTLPVAQEGALKLKEIAYVHAEGYNAAESKHGPIALIEKDFPVIFIASTDKTRHHLLGNIKEMAARGAKTITILEEDEHIERETDIAIKIPKLRNEELMFIPATVVTQLIAYYAAAGKRIKGKEINPDKPKNLSKVVTVS
ncbi:MAG: Glutamine--fructose-6-phosphate aminotransferase [isomerizing] [Candidatus Heimdallarchaeota archaeon LC_3]|nr:MAG: Glutamine--fructose-6-phosphate aminotransferase [isomerizing] [Candidatus Heimdallarchaeota archaeon LC_3]